MTANDLRVRWRLGGGRQGQWQTLTFDEPAQVEHARELVRAHRQSIDKETVYATVMRLPVGDTGTDQPLVHKLVDPWLASKHTMTPGVRDRYRKMFRYAVFPVIGDLPINRVQLKHIDQIIQRLNTCDCVRGVRGSVCQRRKGRKAYSGPHLDGLKARTIDKYYVLMQGFFEFAIKRGYIEINPVLEIEWQTGSMHTYAAEQKEDLHFYMEPDEYQILRAHMDERYQLLLDLMVETGVRYGEATALRPRHFNLNAKPYVEIRICEAWKRDEDGSFYVGKPKNNLTRTLKANPELIESLLPLLISTAPDDLLFTAPKGGRLESANFWNCFWSPAVIAAMRCLRHPVPDRASRVTPDQLAGPRCGDNGGVSKRNKMCRFRLVPGWNRCAYHLGPDPLAVSDCECWDVRLPKKPVIHDLRHTHAATLIRRGVPMLAVARRLGHKSTEITEAVYAGLLKSLDHDIVAASRMGPVRPSGAVASGRAVAVRRSVRRRPARSPARYATRSTARPARRS